MRRVSAAVILVWLPLVVPVVGRVAWSDRLPDPIATHWGPGGGADRFSSFQALFAVTLLVGALCGGIALVAAARLRSTPGFRFAVTAAGATAGGTAGAFVATAQMNLADPADPRLSWWLVLFVVGLAWGLVVRQVAGPSPATGSAPESAEPLPLGPDERAAFATTLSSPLLTGAAALTGAVVLALALTVSPGLWVVLLVPLAVTLCFARIRVTVDRRGLRLVAALIGLPLKRIPLARIEAAQTATIEPGAWGGWGYRILPGRSALVLRRGPGLVLHLDGGRQFAVTLDRPEVPAGLLAALGTRSKG
ncbi:DUF1648 domain-containing protein [Kineosporia rhizophila]|uniref:DUF1648 domain-containing protein n=1 Tax=Kineosporia rhizophila TaxID=84633 RepID=UPI001E5EB45A|nr:DUF1648 domain-containing protein [Kineosporia rhizophila]MCE0537903.1 DUF1648 domain-containing protein [Kineosporia rhizophila]